MFSQVVISLRQGRGLSWLRVSRRSVAEPGKEITSLKCLPDALSMAAYDFLHFVNFSYM